jgi:hypothetical protein
MNPPPSEEQKEALLAAVQYGGSSKHKINPTLFGLEPYRGERGDETCCDRDAGFGPEHMATIPALMSRGIRAGLIGTGRLMWTVADSGWIFEARLTNPDQSEYHGYPVRPTEPIAAMVLRRYAAWADAHGSDADKQALANCKLLY